MADATKTSVPNTVKGRAREAQRDAKARGEKLKYTDALAMVNDPSRADYSKQRDVLDRIRRAITHLDAAMDSSPCYNDATREQARAVVANIVRNAGTPKRILVEVSGPKDTDRPALCDHIAAALHLAEAANAPSSEHITSYDDFISTSHDGGVLAMRVHPDNMHNDQCVDALRYEYPVTKKGHVVVLIDIDTPHDAFPEPLHVPLVVRTVNPGKGGILELANEVAARSGYTLSERASEYLFRYMDALWDDHFVTRAGWREAVTEAVDKSVDACVDAILKGDDVESDGFTVRAEDVYQGMRKCDGIHHRRTGATPDRVRPQEWIQILGSDSVENYDPKAVWELNADAPLALDVGTEVCPWDQENGGDGVRGPRSYTLDVSAGNGVVYGDSKDVQSFLNHRFVFGLAAKFSLERVQFMVLSDTDSDWSWVDAFPHVIAWSHDPKKFGELLKQEVLRRGGVLESGDSVPRLFVVLEGGTPASIDEVSASMGPLFELPGWKGVGVVSAGPSACSVVGNVCANGRPWAEYADGKVRMTSDWAVSSTNVAFHNTVGASVMGSRYTPGGSSGSDDLLPYHVIIRSGDKIAHPFQGIRPYDNSDISIEDRALMVERMRAAADG